VIGSARLAANGGTVEAILSKYFPGTELTTLPSAARE
jgi:peptidoglycan hydrolase-like amidase